MQTNLNPNIVYTCPAVAVGSGSYDLSTAASLARVSASELQVLVL